MPIRDQGGAQKRQVDPDEDLQRRGAVDLGGLVELEGDAVRVLAQDPDRVRGGEGRHREDQRQAAVEKAVIAHDPVERDGRKAIGIR